MIAVVVTTARKETVIMNKKITWDKINSKYPTNRSTLNKKKKTGSSLYKT